MRSSTSTERLAVPLLLAALVAGCTIGDAGSAAPSSSPAPSVAGISPAPPAAASRPASAAPSGGAVAAKPGSWQAAFARALADVDGAASVAVAGDRTVVIGSEPVAAWSTSKVPLAMAALGRAPTVTANIRAAIVESDNAAAEAIWASLGTPREAGAAVQRVLRANGDATTVVQTTRVRPQYTAFGQTLWANGDAAAFAAHVPCSPQGRAVLDLMRGVAGNQQWGVHGLAGAKSVGVKGGWGPGADGGYLVRQLAVIETGRGYTGAMLTVRPNDGSLASGRAALTRLASVFAQHLAALPVRRC